MASPFVSAANDLANGEPRWTGFTFDSRKRFGIVEGDLGEPLLNLGVEGAMVIMATAETFDDRDIAAVFHLSSDREEFRRWFVGFKHTFNGTLPNTAEHRALKAMNEQANATLYRLMGLPVADPVSDGERTGE